jgi:uncharacterized protein YggE
MIPRIAFAVFVSLTLTSSAALAVCPSTPSKAHTAKARAEALACANRVNLGAVPAISANVVASEPAPVVKAPTYADPKAAPYEGPTLGMSKPDPGVRPVPTVGYHWLLE